MASLAVKPRLDRMIRGLGVSNDFIYRDWALTYVLTGLGASPALRDSLVFKGGTALRKCLVRNWRYSVDLDFSSVTPFECADLLEHLRAAIPIMSKAASDYGQLLVTVEHVEHRDAHPGGQCQFKVQITIPGGSRTAAKLEISMDEPIVLKPARQPLLHDYPPEPATLGDILRYSVNEIACEKLRAYLQSLEHVAARGWVAGRSRDTFDLALLHRAKLVDPTVVASILREKCDVRQVRFTPSRRAWSDRKRLKDRPPNGEATIPSLPGFADDVASDDEIVGGAPLQASAPKMWHRAWAQNGGSVLFEQSTDDARGLAQLRTEAEGDFVELLAFVGMEG